VREKNDAEGNAERQKSERLQAIQRIHFEASLTGKCLLLRDFSRAARCGVVELRTGRADSGTIEYPNLHALWTLWRRMSLAQLQSRSTGGIYKRHFEISGEKMGAFE
jgi:hypothetical protein